LHDRDIKLLSLIQSFFGAGTIRSTKSDGSILFSVKSLPDITNKIIPHFEKYPLLTQKRADFLLFKRIIELMNKKEHLTTEGLHKIVGIRAAMNKGLTDLLIKSFPSILPVQRPPMEGLYNITPGWLVGFTEAEGCFLLLIHKSKTINTGYSAVLRLEIGQHSRDAKLLASIVKFLGCGKFRESSTNQVCLFVVAKLSDLLGKIIPLFDQYKLQGAKRLDYLDFKRAAELLENKAHFTNEGLGELRKLRAGMNSGRKQDSDR
jgi:hypothetical protein